MVAKLRAVFTSIGGFFWSSAISPDLLLLPRVVLQGILGRSSFLYGWRTWADPPSCTVGEPRKHYLGENAWPLIIQNTHRYFMYLALAFLLFLSMDVWAALWFPDPSTGRVGFGIGVGTLVLATNVVLLAGYTFGCHSLRHLVGGGVDCLSQAPLRMKTYRCVSCFNRRHMFWAWTSLVWVAFADLYIRMCAMGIWSDWRIL